MHTMLGPAPGTTSRPQILLSVVVSSLFVDSPSASGIVLARSGMTADLPSKTGEGAGWAAIA